MFNEVSFLNWFTFIMISLMFLFIAFATMYLFKSILPDAFDRIIEEINKNKNS